MIYSSYVPKKGLAKDAAPGVNQMVSHMEKVIKVEGSKKQFSTISDQDFDNLSTASYRAQAANKYDFRDRKGHDIFNWTNHQETVKNGGKKQFCSHQASTTNGNFLHWNTTNN